MPPRPTDAALAASPIRLADAEATAAVGRALSTLLRPGDAVALLGELGAGKTTLVRGLVEALGGAGGHSPTFALVNEYRVGGTTLRHLDLYRLEDPRELRELGLDEIIGADDGIALVEWADRFDVMPPAHLRLTLEHLDDGRRMTLAGVGPRGHELVTQLARALTAAISCADPPP